MKMQDLIEALADQSDNSNTQVYVFDNEMMECEPEVEVVLRKCGECGHTRGKYIRISAGKSVDV